MMYLNVYFGVTSKNATKLEPKHMMYLNSNLFNYSKFSFT